MLFYVTLVFALQLAGELIAAAVGLPLPGPVIGMVLLFVILVIRGAIPDDLAAIGDTLLANFSLLFVPAGVGIMLHLDLVRADLVPISIALIASTLLTIAVTAGMMIWLRKPDEADADAPTDAS